MSLALTLILGASTSCSTDPAMPEPQVSASLDALFDRLQATQNAEEAQMIEVTIRQVWSRSGHRGVDAMMGKAAQSVHAGAYKDALAILNKVVEAAPDYAEGWNLRATVHYLQDDYGAALGDIEHVLSLEPRHFGALAGLGRIFLELDDKKAAAKAFEAALAVNPHLNDVRDELDGIREELAGIPI